MFELESGLIVWETISFILLLCVLRLFTWKPLIATLRAREESIRQAIESAGLAKRDAECLLRDSRNALLSSDRNFESIRQRSQLLIDQIQSAFLAVAEKQVECILNETSQEIRRIKERAVQQLQAEVGVLIVESAGAIIDNTLDVERHRRITDAAFASLPA